MSDKTAEEPDITVWSSWEMTYRPFPNLLKDKGFDYFLSTVADAVHDPEHTFMTKVRVIFGDVHVSGHFDEKIVFAVDEPEESDNPFSRPNVELQEVFQDMIAALLRRLGLEGSLDGVQRVVTVMADEADADQ